MPRQLDDWPGERVREPMRTHTFVEHRSRMLRELQLAAGDRVLSDLARLNGSHGADLMRVERLNPPRNKRELQSDTPLPGAGVGEGQGRGCEFITASNTLDPLRILKP